MSEKNGRAQLAEHIYEQRWKTELEANHLHEYVAIDPYTEKYYLGRTLSEAIDKARLGDPELVTYVIRIGHPAAIEFAGG